MKFALIAATLASCLMISTFFAFTASTRSVASTTERSMPAASKSAMQAMPPQTALGDMYWNPFSDSQQ